MWRSAGDRVWRLVFGAVGFNGPSWTGRTVCGRLAGPGRGLFEAPRVAVSGGVGRQNPDSRRAGESAADEVTQIESCGAACEPGVVLDGAAIAEFQAAAAVAGDLGDDPFHVGPERPVFLTQSGFGGPMLPSPVPPSHTTASTAEQGPPVVFPDDGAEGRLREGADDIKNSSRSGSALGHNETVSVRPSGLLGVVQTTSSSPGAIPGGLMSALIACGHAHGGCSEVSGAARLVQLGATPISVTTVGVQSKRIGADLHGQVRLLSALGIVSAGR